MTNEDIRNKRIIIHNYQKRYDEVIELKMLIEFKLSELEGNTRPINSKKASLVTIKRTRDRIKKLQREMKVYRKLFLRYSSNIDELLSIKESHDSYQKVL